MCVLQSLELSMRKELSTNLLLRCTTSCLTSEPQMSCNNHLWSKQRLIVYQPAQKWHPFLQMSQKKFAIKNKDGSLEKLAQSRAMVENGVHHRQCDHTARKASLFCDIHKNRKPDILKTLHTAFKALEQRNKSIDE